jgi:hypothetical protein
VSEENISAEAPLPPQQSFGTAPTGTESVGSAPSGEGVGAAPVEAPAKKKSGLPRIVLSVAIVAVLAAIGWFLSRNDVVNAKVGDCFPASVMSETLTDASNTKTVDCSGSDAAYKVVGIIDNKKSSDFKIEDCASYSTAIGAVWLGKENEAGKVYCVEAVKK